MRWNFLSNKGSSAPYAYLALQIFFLTSAYFASPYFKVLVTSRYAVFFGLDLFLTLLFYFVTHFRDPGYIPHDGIFFTEQEEQWTKSHMKLQNNPQDSQSMSRHDTNRLIHQNNLIEEKTRGVSKALMGKIGLGLGGEAQALPAFQNMVEEDHSHQSFDCKEEEEQNAAIEMIFKTEEDDDDSNYEQGPQSQDLETGAASSKVDATKQEGHEPQETLEKELGTQEKSNKIDGNGSPAKVNNQPSNATTKAATEEREQNKEQDHSPIYHTSQETNSLVALHTDQKLNTNEDSHKKEAVNKGESPNAQANKGEYQHTGEGLELQKATKPRTPLNRSTNTITKTEVTYMEAPETERASTPNANLINEIRKLDAKGAETVLKNGEKHINITPGNLDENLQKDDLEAQKKEEHKVEIDYIERRYCTVCNLEQPIRARHCKHCNKCVACYDHHCPWLGSCIGEKNHFFFIWYLFFQLIEVAFAQLELAYCFFDYITYSIEIRALQVISSVGISFFTLMVTLLFFYHLYLASQNLTTWESLSWSKISYLKELPQKKGSPFSEGWKKNLSYFFSQSYKGLRKWRYTPEYKASLATTAP